MEVKDKMILKKYYEAKKKLESMAVYNYQVLKQVDAAIKEVFMREKIDEDIKDELIEEFKTEIRGYEIHKVKKHPEGTSEAKQYDINLYKMESLKAKIKIYEECLSDLVRKQLEQYENEQYIKEILQK